MAFHAPAEKKVNNPIPNSVYLGVCVGLIDLGTQYNDKFKKREHKILYMWELPTLPIKFERDGEEVVAPRVISKKYTLSLAQKANLFKDIVSWICRPFTDSEIGKDGKDPEFDFESLLGKNCMLQIMSTDKDGKSYANVTAILPPYDGVPYRAPVGEVRVFRLAPGMTASDVPATIPSWIRDIILKSEEITGKRAGEPIAPVDEPHIPPATDDDTPF